MPGEKTAKAKKVASRRRVLRSPSDKAYSKREGPSPRTFRRFQAAYEEALKRSLKSSTSKPEKKVVKKTPAVKSRRTKAPATTSTSSKAVASTGKSAYQKFVQKKMKQTDMKGLPATERMRLIASLWKDEKSKK